MRYYKNPDGSIESYQFPVDQDVTKMEGHSKAVEITEAEYNTILASIPVSPPTPKKIKLKDLTTLTTKEYEIVG